MKIVTAQHLIENPHNGSHIVLLGAGTSRAAFPNGDATGLKLPVMDDLVEILGLQPLIVKTGLDVGPEKNFELIYSQLASEHKHASIVEAIERRVDEYFSSLSLPDRATIYDCLLLSLRPTDAVLSFNWDPFLFDAYQRNREAVRLPMIFFLHGNVRIGACTDHDIWGARNTLCSNCSRFFTDVPLLYPIQKKNYSANRYTQASWEVAKTLLDEAFTLTIFGYGAPTSDVDAIELLKRAWLTTNSRNMERIEIIDIAPQTLIHDRWSPFTPTLHYNVQTDFQESRIARWPRRTCESSFYPMTQGIPCEDFRLPNTDSLEELQTYAAVIAQHE